ncbi:MAG TPA: 30S ribosomal protein S20 [Candidatus Saccharimonadales bacterium]|nr:30S ribosomal protein S20 [Candidatus Saccharimonadales bacterium]
MPIIKSAKKRVKTAQKAAVRNSKSKRSLKEALKVFHKAVSSGSKDVKKAESSAASALDKAVKKGLLHKNKVARKKRQLARASKPAATSTAKAKPAAKKATTKAAPAKKTVSKKPAVKKTAKK